MEEKQMNELLKKVGDEVKAKMDGFTTPEQLTEAVKTAIDALKTELKPNIDANEELKTQIGKLEHALKVQGEAMLMLKSGAYGKKEENKSFADKIVDAFKTAKVDNFMALKECKGFAVDIQHDVIKDSIYTGNYTGTVSRTQAIGNPMFPPVRPLAFMPYARTGVVTNGKDRIMWVPSSYTSNVGYAGEGTNTTSEDAATATEKTRGMAKISAWNQITAETFEDLPQFAQQLQGKLLEGVNLFTDVQMWIGDGNDSTHPDHVYGIKTQGCTAFDAASAISVEKPNIADLIDAMATQAEVGFFVANTVRMSPRLANKLRRTKDADGQYIVTTLVTGEEVIGGKRVIRTTVLSDNELIVGNDSLMQLWSKRAVTLKVGQFDDDAKKDKYTALVFARVQCLVEDYDKVGIVYCDDVESALVAIKEPVA